MKKLLFLIILGLFTCAHASVYELWEITYFAGSRDQYKLGTFLTKEQCEKRLKDLAKSDSREAFYNRDREQLGNIQRFCSEKKQ